MSLALGIDIGTSGVRTAVIDSQRQVISMARADHLPQDPDRIDATKWWHAVQTCLKRQVSALRDIGRDPKQIESLAVDGTSGTMVLTDSDLTPVTRALMYNSKGFDIAARRIAAIAPAGSITLGSNSALARAMTLVSEAADRRPAHLLHQADFVTAKLIGYGGESDHNNALKTGFDPQSGQWPGWIDAVIDPALLPDAKPVGATIAPLEASLAEAFGLSPRLRVHAGTTDSVAAFLAAAPAEEGVAVTSLGSTLAVKLIGPTRIDDPSIGLYAHRLKDQWLVGGASNTGGAVLSHFFDKDALVRLSERIDPTKPTSYSYYPLLTPGERFPINDPDYQPRLHPRPADDVAFLQGMLEGIARIESQCYREIQARGGGFPTQLFSAGGGSVNSVFREIRARTLNMPLEPPAATEAAVGAAFCAQGL